MVDTPEEADGILVLCVALLEEEDEAVEDGWEEATRALVLVRHCGEVQRGVLAPGGDHLAIPEADVEGLLVGTGGEEEEDHTADREVGAPTRAVRARPCQGVEVGVEALARIAARGRGREVDLTAREGPFPAHARGLSRLHLVGVGRKARLIEKIAEVQMTFEAASHVAEVVHHRSMIQESTDLFKTFFVGTHALHYYWSMLDIIAEIHMEMTLEFQECLVAQ
jgi:hypothetical protein